jgi:AcrR family transcriptional regulator
MMRDYQSRFTITTLTVSNRVYGVVMTKPGRKRDQDAEERILNATRDLIAERGSSQVTIDEIAAEAKVGKQTIYRWWPTKPALVLDALEREIKSSNPPPTTGSTYGDLRTQMRRVAAMFASPTGSIIRELVAESIGNDDIAEQFRKRFFAERLKRGMPTLEAGIARGELRADLDLEIVSEMLYAPLWLRLIIEHRPLTPAIADRILDHAWPILTTDPTPTTTRPS